MKIKIQDQVREFNAPVTVYDAAKEMELITRAVIGAEIDGTTVALTQEITSDAEVKLLTFEDALKAAETPSADYDIQKWLYAPSFYSEYRYILGTRGKHPLICIGINPSTAEPDHLDNTLKSV